MTRKAKFENAPKEVRDEVTKYVKDLHEVADTAELFIKMVRAITEQSFVDGAYDAIAKQHVDKELMQRALGATLKLCNQAQMDMMMACLGLAAFIEESEREDVERLSGSLVAKLEGTPDVRFPFHI